MNPLDLTPIVWPALVRATLHGSIALIAVFAICRLFPRIPAAAQCWLWRLAWLRILIAFCTGATFELSLLPAPTPIIAARIEPQPVQQLPPPTDLSVSIPATRSITAIDSLALI